MIPGAGAQTYIPSWSPETVEVAESSGTIELTITKGGPGHVRYRTEDGSCETRSGPTFTEPERYQCRPPAQAPNDYGAVSGDLIFAEGGSKTIRVPIVDDNVDETSEAFTVYAHEGDETAGGWTGTNGTVWIVDDDGDADNDACRSNHCPWASGPGELATTPTTTARRGASQGSSPPSTVPPGRLPPPSELKAELASGDLRPGPGFELVIGADPQATPARDGHDDGSAPWSALGRATVAVAAGTGGVVWVRRRRRWSPS